MRLAAAAECKRLVPPATQEQGHELLVQLGGSKGQAPGHAAESALRGVPVLTRSRPAPFAM